MNELPRNVQSRADFGLSKIAQLERIPENYVLNYSEQIKYVNSQIDLLDKALRSTEGTYKQDMLKGWSELAGKTEQAVVIRLKKSLLKYPDLKIALEQVGETFRAESISGPLLANVNAKYQAVREYSLRHRVFHADSALTDLNKEAQSALNQLQNTGIDASALQDARETIENWSKNGQRLYDDSFRSLTKTQSVQTFFLDEGKALVARCKKAALRMDLNCELLGSLTGLTVEQIGKMSTDQLRYFEYQFDKVKFNPIR